MFQFTEFASFSTSISLQSNPDSQDGVSYESGHDFPDWAHQEYRWERNLPLWSVFFDGKLFKILVDYKVDDRVQDKDQVGDDTFEPG